MLISISDYAKIHNVARETVQDKCRRGTINATKIANRWLIDENEPYIDYRTHDNKKLRDKN